MEQHTIKIQAFIEQFTEKFDNPFPGGFQPQSLFREHPEWSSLLALVVVVGFEEDYGVTITARELQEAKTVEDLYHLVTGKLQD